LPDDNVDRYLVQFDEPGAATGILSWYRAVAFTPPSQLSEVVTVPTLYIYGGRDVALGRRAADLTRDYVDAEYRYEVLEDASHWMPEEVPDVVTKLIVEHAVR
jgi:pimeloyl-ACP methyl ester carboxylesterase